MPFFLNILIQVGLGLLLQLLTPSPKLENAKKGRFQADSFPKAEEGQPYQVFFGKVKIESPTYLHYQDLKSQKIKQKVKTGLFSSKSQTIGYKYFLDFALSLGLGTDCILYKIWADGKLIYTNTAGITTYTQVNIFKEKFYGGKEGKGGIDLHIQFQPGNFNEVISAGWGTPGEWPAYRGQCIVLCPDCYVGNENKAPALAFEVGKYPDSLAISPKNRIGDDANPVAFFHHCLTNTWDGVGIPIANIDTASFTAAALKIFDEGLGVSGVISSSISLAELKEEIERVVEGVIFEDPATNKITIKLIRNDYTVGSLFVVNPSNVIHITNKSSSLFNKLTNEVRCTYIDRDAGYVQKNAIAQDQSGFARNTRRESATYDLAFVKKASVANTVASRQLGNMSLPLMSISVIVNRTLFGIKPGDVVNFMWPDFGIVSLPMRVQKVAIGSLDNNSIKLDLTQDRFGIESSIFADPPATSWIGDNFTALPASTLVLETPRYFMRKGVTAGLVSNSDDSYLLHNAKAPNTSHLDYVPEVTIDGVNYGDDNPRTSFNPTARVAVNYLATASLEFDSTIGLVIDTVDNPALLLNYTVTDLNTGFGFFLAGQEILQYETFTNLGGGQYRLNNVWRGCLDTVVNDHLIGETIYFIPEIDGLGNTKLIGTESTITRMITHTPNEELETADAPLFPLVLANRSKRPYPPDTWAMNGSRYFTSSLTNAITFSWLRRSREQVNSLKPNAADEAPSTATDYLIVYKINGGAPVTQVLGTTSPQTFTFPTTEATIELDFYSRESVGSVLSLFPIKRTFEITPPLTTLFMLQIPLISAADNVSPTQSRLYWIGNAPGLLQNNLGAGFNDTGDTSTKGFITGAITTAPSITVNPLLFDDTSAMRVNVTTGVVRLATITETEFKTTRKNLAIIVHSGGQYEIIQYRTVTLITATTYEFTRLKRGLFNTQLNTPLSKTGATFLGIVGYGSNVMPNARLNLAIPYRAYTTGQSPATGGLDTETSTGVDLRPFTVTDIQAINSSNNVLLSWRRRSRIPTAAFQPSPLGETSELYDVEIYSAPSGILKRTMSGLTSTNYNYTTAQQTTDGFTIPMTQITVRIFQVSAVVGRGIVDERTITIN